MAWLQNKRKDAPVEAEPSLPVATAVRTAKPSPSGDGEATSEWYVALKRKLHQDVIGAMDLSTIGTLDEDDLRLEVRHKAEELCRRNSELLSLSERERLVEEVLDEAFGYGPIEGLMHDAEISDILINGPKQVYIERAGRLSKLSIAFHDERHLLQIVQRMAANVGRRVDENSPMVDARLPDGSRLNAIIQPLALNGPLVSIRRFGATPLTIDKLLAYGSITPEMLEFLRACVVARINMVISGGTGSGKTTLLNALSRYIPADERLATIEDSAELQLQQPHVVRMETRPPNIEGEGEVTTRDLVRNALRMRPDRIIVGECRGAEALDMLQAMNTGHEGSLTTIHANSPRDSISRLEMMVGMTGFDIPIWVIRKQVASSINVIIQVQRLIGGKRKIVKITEVTGMEGDVLSMHDIFEFVQTGVDEHRAAEGFFRTTGMRPECLAKLNASGMGLPVEMFERRTLECASSRSVAS
jgi:pilus assembly protein CpaF